MAKHSIVVKIADGVSNQFSISFTGGFMSRDHVTARVNNEVDGLGDPSYRPITWITDGIVQVGGDMPENGVEVEFRRTTPIDTPVNDFQNGAVLLDVALDEGFEQAIKRLQEVEDTAGELLVVEGVVDEARLVRDETEAIKDDVTQLKTDTEGLVSDAEDAKDAAQLAETGAAQHLSDASTAKTDAETAATASEDFRDAAEALIADFNAASVDDSPDEFRLLVYGDDQAKSSAENDFGHDEIAVQGAVYNEMVTNTPFNALLHVGDAMDSYRYDDSWYTGSTDTDLVDQRKEYFADAVDPRNYMVIAGNHDDDNDESENFIKHERHHGKGNWIVEYNDVIIIGVSTENKGTEGHINDGVFEWWKRTVRRNQDKFIITALHQPLGDSTSSTAGTNSQQAASYRFYEAMQEPFTRCDVLCAGHVGGSTNLTDPGTLSHVKINGCWHIQCGLHIPGAYDAATVPVWDLSYVVFDFTRGSKDVVCRRRNATTSEWVASKEFTIQAQHKLYPSGLPTKDTRDNQGWDDHLLWNPDATEYDLVTRFPWDVKDEVAVSDVSTTNGTPNLTFTHTAHGLSTGDYRWLSISNSVGGIEPHMVPRWSPVTVVDANTLYVKATQDAASTATGGGTIAYGTKGYSTEPFWVNKVKVHEPSMNTYAGMTIGNAFYHTGDANDNGEKDINSWGFSAAFGAIRKTDDENDYSGNAGIWASKEGRNSGSRVLVMEADALLGAVDHVAGFKRNAPVFSVTEQTNFVLSSNSSPYTVTNMTGTNVSVGDYMVESATEPYIEGQSDGDVLMVTWSFSTVPTDGNTNEDEFDVYFELREADGTTVVNSGIGKVSIAPSGTRKDNGVCGPIPVAIDEGQRLYCMVEGAAGNFTGYTTKFDRSHLSGYLVSTKN